MKSRSNTWRCDVAEIRGRWSRLGERSFKKSSQENNEKPTLAPAAKPNNTFPRRSKGSDWASPVGEILCIGLENEMKRTPKWSQREISPESKNPAKKMGFTTNMPLFLRAFDCTMMLVNILISMIFIVQENAIVKLFLKTECSSVWNIITQSLVCALQISICILYRYTNCLTKVKKKCNCNIY